MSSIKVFIVDDNFVARRGLRSVLEAEDGIAVVGEASSGSEALKRLHECPADVVLMDIRMSDIDGIEATSMLLREKPDARILMATVIDDPAVHMNAMLAGARGYLVYGHFAPESLTDAIRAVASGQLVNIPSIPEEARIHRFESERGVLTQREDEILRLIAAGKDNREIAASLDIEEKTVKNHINSIYSKISVRSRREAIYYMLDSMFKEAL
ncbi:MAG: DNA-binding response regulator [Dehalococcoidia bacterium]|nr:MAG: DNA-binding response regulator [Dehalococcoidia bacterium]